MSSPTKRRKKNDPKFSHSPGRSLDYFFARQRHKSDTTGTSPPIQNAAKSPDTHTTESHFADEELAKRLQDEWNKEDGAHSIQEHRQVVMPLDDGSDINGKQCFHETVSPRRTPDHHTLKLQSTAATEDTIAMKIPFDESPLTFQPSRYVPVLQSHWAAQDGRATYALLTRCFVLVNNTKSRIRIVDSLVNLLRTVMESDPDSMLPTVWLATNSISPPYIDLELGLGASAISKSLAKLCGLSGSRLRALFNKYGDAGDVAFAAKKRQSFTLRKPKPLTVQSVYDSLVQIANSKGKGSQDVKQAIVDRLLQDSRGAEESRYIVRTLGQHLRIGAVKTTMLIALSRAFLTSRPGRANFPIQSTSALAKMTKEQLTAIYSHAEEIVKACFARRPNYNDLVSALLEVGVCDELLVRCGVSLHIPIRPMLGGITRDLEEMLMKLQGREFSCEFKYDGQRAQVHCDEHGKITIFSRHLEVMTDKYPDLVSLIPQIRGGEGVSSFILEGEVVAIDRDTGHLKPFQLLSNRARKDVVIRSVKIDVCLFAFDLMYLNGEELLDRPFRERRSLLRTLFVEIPHRFTMVQSLDASSADQQAVGDFFQRATAEKCEGIMVKVLDNLSKPDVTDGLAESHSHSASNAPQKKVKPWMSDPSSDNREGDGGRKVGYRRKALLATYEPDKRLDSWLKVKKDYHTSADTIDLIPVGAWHGNGRKCKWWSPILLAVRNPDTGSLEVITKCMSGFTDKFYAENRAKYSLDVDGVASDDNDDGGDEHQTNGGSRISNVRCGKPAFVEYSGEADVWFEPQEVWECAFADITLSPTYTAAIGLVSEDRGLSLRFPRFLRVREDKSIEEASTTYLLAELYRKQADNPPDSRLDAEDDAK